MIAELLERTGELDHLAAAAEAAWKGIGGFVLIEGAPGIGKSRLLDAVAALAGPQLTLVARSGEGERDFPFGVPLQLYEPVLARREPEQRGRLLTGSAGLAAPLFDAAPWGRTEEVDSEARHSLVHGLYWLTANLTEEAPLAILVDDLHWADRSSLAFLRYLSQRIADLPVLVVGTLRPGDVDSQELEQLRALSTATRLTPKPLSADAVGRIVREELPAASDEICAACADATGGNPFLLHELLLALANAREEAPRPEAIHAMASEPVGRRLALRIAGLSPSAEPLMGAAVVLGDGAPLRHAAALAQLDPDEAISAADELMAADVLRGVDPIMFAHPLVRASLYERLPAGDRARRHSRAARLLAAEGVDAERLTPHLLRAQRSGDAVVVDRLREAAAAASARGAPESAITLLERALEEPPPPELRPEVLLELGLAEAATGHPGAPATVAKALELTDDPRRAGEIAFLLGRRLYSSSRLREAAEVFDAGLARLNGRDPELALRLESGFVTAARLQVERRPEAIARLQPLLGRIGTASSSTERILLAHVAFERVAAGAPRDEVVDLARRALADGELLSDQATDGMAFTAAVCALGYADELEEAVAALDGAVERARARGSALEYAGAVHFRAYVLYRQGRVHEAAADAAAALDLARAGSPVAGLATNAIGAEIAIERGALAEARAVLDVPSPQAHAGTAPFAYYLLARGRLLLIEGNPEGALADLLACGELLEALHAPNPAVVPWRAGAARAAHALGDETRARALAAEALELARNFGARRAIGIALMTAAATGAEGPVAALEEAVATLEPSQARLEHARALVELGGALRRGGKRREARERLQQGREMARACGATVLLERAFDELRAAGARPRREAASGLEALTPSEHRVVSMAARGLTNKEIAQALFVTVKAVEWHLGNSYRKLGVRARGDLPEILGEREGE